MTWTIKLIRYCYMAKTGNRPFSHFNYDAGKLSTSCNRYSLDRCVACKLMDKYEVKETNE